MTLINKNFIRKVSLFSFAIVSLLTSFSCKEYTILPPDLVPPVDNISTFQDFTIPIETYNYYQDSLVTGGTKDGNNLSGNSSFYHGIGNIELDPMFGSTKAIAHVEVIPPAVNYQFKEQFSGTQRTIDSMVLSIPFQFNFGDTINYNPQTFNVFRSIQAFPKTETQYEFTQDKVDRSKLLGSQTINFQTFAKDSPYVGTSKVVPQLRFKLSQEFSDSLEAQIDLGANGAGSSYANFLTWLNGFSIEPANSHGATLGYFNTYGTRLNIYYRYTNTNALQDTVADVFAFDPTYCNRFNTITHDYSTGVASKFLSSRPPLGDSVLFIQNAPGIGAELSFPTLANLSNRVVNKAELIFTSVSPFPFDFSNLYGSMPRMQILQVGSDGVDKFPSDYSTFNSSFVDGYKSLKVINGITYTQYKFNLTQSFQKAISQKDTTFKLKIMGQNNGYPAAYRIMLGGSGSVAFNTKPVLNLIYTKID